jgi:hypothetical protein
VIGRLSPQAGRKIREASRELSGVNETVASGLSLPLTRPWLLVVPIALDLLLWLGMQVQVTRITDPLEEQMLERGGENGEIAAEQIALLGETFRLNDVIGSLLPSVFAGLSRDNLFNVMIATFAPGLAGGVDRSEIAPVWSDRIGEMADPGSIPGILGLAVAFFLVSTLLTVSWRVPLALSVIGRAMAPIAVVRLVIRSWVRFVALLALLAFAAGVILIPLVLVAGILLLLQVNLTALISIFMVMLGTLAAIYARFVLESIIVNDIGPIDALKRSALIAQTFFGATVRFSIVAVLLATGALRLWEVLVSSPPGLPLALIVNSFLGTGIAIATMMFYHDRDRLIRRFAPVQPSHDRSHPPL